MSGDKTTKTVFRILMAWNDQKEERWLAEQERAGWHLKTVRPFGYTFEKASPAEVAYRLDFQAISRENREEYLALFQDSGWEHVGARGHVHYFRQSIVDGKVPEIFTDPASRVLKYQRVAAALGMMLIVLVVVVAPKWPVPGPRDQWRAVDMVYACAFFLKLAAMAFLIYSIVRLTRLISRMKKSRSQGV